MKYILGLILMFSFSANASWAPLELESAVCETEALIFVGKYESTYKEGYFLASFPGEKEKYWMDLGKFSVTKVLRNNQKVTYMTEDQLLAGLNLLLDGRCEGGLCHMTLPQQLGAQGIWLVNSRHQHTGSFMPIGHPDIPLAMSRIQEVEKILRNCPQ